MPSSRLSSRLAGRAQRQRQILESSLLGMPKICGRVVEKIWTTFGQSQKLSALYTAVMFGFLNTVSFVLNPATTKAHNYWRFTQHILVGLSRQFVFCSPLSTRPMINTRFIKGLVII